MTELSREEVLRIAKECGFWGAETNSFGVSDKLERFATVIYEACAKSMQADGWRQCAKDQHTSQFCVQAEAAYAKGAEDMRERAANECVAVNQKRTNAGFTHGYNAIMDCHDAIRALPITPTNTEGEQ